MAQKKTKRAATKTTKSPAPKRSGTKSGGRKRAKTKAKAEAEAPRRSAVIAIAETTVAGRKRASDVCEQLGYRVVTADDPDAAAVAIAEADTIDIVLAGMPGCEAAIAAARARKNDAPAVIAAMAGPATTAPERCQEAGADLFTLRPLDKDAVASLIGAGLALGLARDRVKAAEGSESMARERLLRYGESDSLTGFQHFDFFRKLLVIELKRAKRYKYPLAACLVAIDPWDGDEPSADGFRKLRTKVASAVSASIRDIDVPVDVAEDRLLVFLPYTDIDGAERVGRRVAGVVKSYGSVDDGGRTVNMSVSVGIAALRPGKPVSFARLMRDANLAIRAAQLKGGGQVVVKK